MLIRVFFGIEVGQNDLFLRRFGLYQNQAVHLDSDGQDGVALVVDVSSEDVDSSGGSCDELGL